MHRAIDFFFFNLLTIPVNIRNSTSYCDNSVINLLSVSIRKENKMPGKRGREEDGLRVAYTQDSAERAARVKEFIKGLKLTIPIAKLRSSVERKLCPKCQKKRLYYCYDCLAICSPETHPPPLKLPLPVHVILHPGEHRSKSTSLAASTISPDIHIHEWPGFPEGIDLSSTALLYPSPTAKCLDELAPEDFAKIKTVLFVDSTWQQSKAISRDPRLHQAIHIRIKQQISLFWRFQNNDPTYLATVEAIYFFLKEYVQAKNAPTHSYNGEVDDLLHYYVNQYITVQSNYSGSTTTSAASTTAGGAEEKPSTTGAEEKQFTTRHFADYILKDVDWSDVVGTGNGSPAKGEKEEKK